MKTNPLTRTAKSLFLKVWPDSTTLRHLAYLPKFENFCRANIDTYPVFENRFRMYEFINKAVGKDTSVDYLEFGVFKGETIRYWSCLNTSNNSRFIGFDTFEGLNEDWTDFRFSRDMESFSTNGMPPETDDTRIEFHKGLFQQTLTPFLRNFDSNRQLIIHNDSDLYSSTLYVLAKLDDVITHGTIIIFDEIWSVLHEFRALEDYCSSFGREFEVIGGTTGPSGRYQEVAIRMK